MSGTSSTRRCRIRRSSAASSRATACSSSGWRPPTRSSNSARDRRRRRAFPVRTATRTASEAGRVRPRRWRHWREPQLARGLSYLLIAAQRPRIRADRSRRQRRAGQLRRQEPARDRRLRLEVRAERQRAGDATSSCRASTSGGARAAISRTTATARSALTQTSSYSVAAERLVRRRASTSSCPQWRVGARYDRLDPGNVDYGANACVPRARRRSIRSGIR